MRGHTVESSPVCPSCVPSLALLHRRSRRASSAASSTEEGMIQHGRHRAALPPVGDELLEQVPAPPAVGVERAEVCRDARVGVRIRPASVPLRASGPPRNGELAATERRRRRGRRCWPQTYRSGRPLDPSAGPARRRCCHCTGIRLCAMRHARGSSVCGTDAGGRRAGSRPTGRTRRT